MLSAHPSLEFRSRRRQKPQEGATFKKYNIGWMQQLGS